MAPVDFDREIQTVGLGNLLSGCTGGFTGSYIFSDTKMALNNVGPHPVAKLCGLVVAAALLGVYALPLSLMTVLPAAFFGGMLLYIAFAFLDETLVHAGALPPPHSLPAPTISHVPAQAPHPETSDGWAVVSAAQVHTWHTCARMEYGVIVGTLAAINVAGVPVGMLTGAMLQVGVFAAQYGVCRPALFPGAASPASAL